MCGIVGKIKLNDKPVIHSEITAMVQALIHRGPDNQGIYCKGSVGLGHSRLSIIDLSVSGHQPMASYDGKTWITFNGEIYNFNELRSDLEKDDYIFRSKTDTEVILALYKKYGENCLNFLRGMFAFAIWDEDTQRLFMARDRIGKKPLKYYYDPSQQIFIFASEIKAILKNTEVKKEINHEALDHYLSLQYIPSPLTIFRSIYKLPPAHYLTLQDGKIEIKKYWWLDFNKKSVLTEDEWKKSILDKLREAVSLRMISDVPLGAFLSGGIDSSAIVAIMSTLSRIPVKTFSIGFKESNYDETRYARIIAEKFKTEHHEFIVEPRAIEILPQLAYHYDEPFADSSAIPTWYLSQLTRRYVTVALNGDGGDETFAGYNRYMIYKADLFSRKFPSILDYRLLKKGAWILNNIFQTRATQKLNRFFSMQDINPQANYIRRIFYFNSRDKEDLYSDFFKERVKKNEIKKSEEILERLFRESGNSNWLDQALYTDIYSYLPEDLMVKVDIASMAHSLECRSPYLDHEFLELTAKIPSSLKINGLNKKYILRETLRTLLPSTILDRPKMGFGVPLDYWFRNELGPFLKERLLSRTAVDRGLFRREAIEQLIKEHTNRKMDNSYRLWSLLFLEEWFRVWID